MPDRSAIVAEALTWANTPFHHQGRLKGVGVDCVGLVIGVARAFGLISYRDRPYPRQPDGTLQAELARHLVTVAVVGEGMDAAAALAQGRPGDVLLLWLNAARTPQHVGILVDGRRMIHAWETVGRVRVNTIGPHMLAHLLAVYAFPGLED